MARTANEIASDVFGALTLENITLRAQVEKLQEELVALKTTVPSKEAEEPSEQ